MRLATCTRLVSAVERTWHVQESQGQIRAFAFKALAFRAADLRRAHPPPRRARPLRRRARPSSWTFSETSGTGSPFLYEKQSRQELHHFNETKVSTFQREKNNRQELYHFDEVTLSLSFSSCMYE